MKIIGLTGGIGSGKSTIATMLAELGAVVIDADQVAKEIVEPGKSALEEIVNYFGSEVLRTDGSLNRQLLGTIIFNDDAKRKTLNQITHPAIKKEFEKQLAYLASNNPKAVVVIEAPLLIEANMLSIVDEVWLAVVEPQVQIKRIMARDGLDYKAALTRIKSQISNEERLPYCDVIISTEKDFAELKSEVRKNWNRLAK